MAKKDGGLLTLRGGGYFFDISEYIKLALTGDIYAKGGHAVYANSSYLKRYHYSGTVNFAYSKTPDQDDKIETNNVTNDSPAYPGALTFATNERVHPALQLPSTPLQRPLPGTTTSDVWNSQPADLLQHQ